MQFSCMEFNVLQLNLMEQDYGRRHVVVPRSGSVKIYELQSALAQKCAACVEMEETKEAKAAAIESFKTAVAAVCPLPPTQSISCRQNRAMHGGSHCGSRTTARLPNPGCKQASTDPSVSQVMAPSPPSHPPPTSQSNCSNLDPNATVFVPHLPRTRARARRIRRQRSHSRHARSLTSDACPTANSKQRRAAHRKSKQEAWREAQHAGTTQHGGVQQQGKVQKRKEMQLSLEQQAAQVKPAAFSYEQLVALNMAPLADAVARDHAAAEREAAAERALAASRDRREALYEAEAFSRKWCGPAPGSIFDVPRPPQSFIDGWFSWRTSRIGGADVAFGKRALTRCFCPPLDRRKRWTYDRKPIDYGDDSFISNIGNKVHVSALGLFF
mmetsp:Transcript_48673/g.80863  ORF Transcript_48673/g.80863 Transcript_48673/m.80863 type:complete len:384 (+) Transcript_48673:264-1415(+)|eukprot:CAMPEP_0119308190 /NCGR_PEP_ID=MMETSP1333-20130426/9307_1 /TAXON_ID=418940 /ORGANISM="Scyphosphaera apsteinii, Strain RCC1455" /LENGTH=383 /DNA_ID=CAMNT_0007311899 /DNA_START=167 /DNA_END=1318 /DNA_ORIENTATION=-